MTDIPTHFEAGVTPLTLNRADRKSAITAAMYSAMADALAQADADGQVRTVVIQGHTVFSAGNDLGDFLNAPPSTNDSPVFRFLRAISSFPKPINSLLETKRLMKKGQASLIAQPIVEENASFGRTLREPAAREAFGAFMARRKPDFAKI